MPDSRKSSRRAFLRGQAAIEALQDVADHVAVDEGIGLPLSASSGYLLRMGRRAMACEFEVLLNSKQSPHGTQAAFEALDLVDQLEVQLTTYRDDSDVSMLNRTAHEQAMKVEPRLFALLQRAAEIHCETDGAYDITSGPLSMAWGFYRREGQMPNEAEISQALECVGMNHIEFDVARQTIKFDRPGIEINLGSIGKGYALDLVAELLEQAGLGDFLLHGGNSSVLGRGTTVGNSGENQGWWVGLRHPHRPDKRLGQVRLVNRALGTSGSGTQFFVHGGRRFGHLLDPRTGWPTEGMLSTTVAASTGADADALATALYVLGADSALDYCRQHPEISAVIMSPGANSAQANIAIWNWADADIQLEDDPMLSVHRHGPSSLQTSP
ncbi:MAG: FAD:protein FMN transferase [Pirellulales bacterium]|nr:FAD:protein FMN transferase [Pirellulales bacterium]